MDYDCVDNIVDKIMTAKKYRHVCRDTVKDVVLQESRHFRKPSNVISASKKRLHRVWASYLGGPNFKRAARQLDKAFFQSENEVVQDACMRIMATHASSRERLPILNKFYTTIFDETGLPNSVVDIACALNPLSLRWMGLPPSVKYRGYDIHSLTVQLVNHYFQLEGLCALAEVRDVLVSPSRMYHDVALLLKMYHCLEHRRRGAGWQVVQETCAKSIIISFPSHNLKGRSVDIVKNYEGDIRYNVQGCGWTCSRLDFDSEIVLVVKKKNEHEE